MSQENFDMDIGTCCFCGNECNSCSQSCGSCARSLTGFSLGWNPFPNSTPNEENEEFINEGFKGTVFYTGIGSEKHQQNMSEEMFRHVIWLNKDKFTEPCPLDPRSCVLNSLVEWTGAELHPE